MAGAARFRVARLLLALALVVAFLAARMRPAAHRAGPPYSRTPVRPTASGSTRPRRGRRFATAVGFAAVLCASVVAGYAAWSALGSGTGTASITVMNPPTATGASAVTAGKANVSWTAPTPPGTGAVTYYVVRMAGAVPSAACGTTPTAPISATSCTDVTANGSYGYIVTALWRTWTSAGTQSAAVTIVNDVTAPVTTVTAPAGGSYQRTPTPTLSGTAGSVVSSPTTSADTATVTVKIFAGPSVGGALLQTLGPVTVTSGAWSTTATALAGGAQYTVQVSQADGAGNTGTGLSTFVLDTTPPSPVVSLPAHGAYLNTLTPALSGTAGTLAATTTTAADTATVTVTVFAGPTATGTALQTYTVAVAAGAWNKTLATLPTGAQYTAQVTQADGAGNLGADTATFVIDTTLPAPTFITPTANQVLTTATLNGNGTAGSALATTTTSADNANLTLQMYVGPTVGGALLYTVSVPVTAGTWSAGGPLANGQYTARITQTDAAGNSGSATVTFFSALTPVPTITAPVNGGWTNLRQPVFTGTAGTAAGDATTVIVNIYAGATVAGALQRTSPAITQTAGAWTWTPPSPLNANAQFTAQVSQSNTFGGPGLSTPVTFVVDNAPPANPLWTTGPAHTSPFSTSGHAAGTFEVQAADATHSPTATTISLSIYAGSGVTGTPLGSPVVTYPSGGNWNVTYTALVLFSQYTMVIISTDGAGNSTQVTSSFTQV
jgi:large repetitive protein